MVILWILLGILILLFMISMLSAHMILEYREDISLTLSVLFLKFQLFPAKKKKIRIADYSKKALEKKNRRKKKTATKKQTKKATTKKAEKNTEDEKKGITERLAEIREMLVVLLDKTFGHLSIRASRIRILVATGDAASTAILFGAVNGAVICLLETLNRFGKLKTKSHDEIEVSPDYLAEKTTADIRFVFSLRVWQMLDILFQTLFAYIKSKNQKQS